MCALEVEINKLIITVTFFKCSSWIHQQPTCSNVLQQLSGFVGRPVSCGLRAMLILTKRLLHLHTEGDSHLSTR
jgi:hypothetical protein